MASQYLGNPTSQKFNFVIQNYSMNPNKLHQKNGFTLVELMVGISLFMIAISISALLFVNILKQQRITLKINAMLANMSLIMEQITREARTGNNLKQGDYLDGSPDFSSFSFISAEDESIKYKWNGDPDFKITKKVGTGEFIAITPEDVKVDSVVFKVANSATQWTRVTIKMQFSPKAAGLEYYSKTLQTTISPRMTKIPTAL